MDDQEINRLIEALRIEVGMKYDYLRGEMAEEYGVRLRDLEKRVSILEQRAKT